MSASLTARDEFIVNLTRYLPEQTTYEVREAARIFLTGAARHSRLAEDLCNGHPANYSPHLDARTLGELQEAWEARIEKAEARCEARLTKLAASLGLGIEFQGDPRGYTVRLLVGPAEARRELGVPSRAR